MPTDALSKGELAYCNEIRARDGTLRSFFSNHSLADPPDPTAWFEYLTATKDILGNINNSIGFIATLLAKAYLARRFGLRDFDAAKKAQGAPGPDIAVITSSQQTIRCEIKTTRPVQPGFGANQKSEIKKDLKKLSEAIADHKIMLVTNADAYKALCKPYYASLAQEIEIVNLLTGETFRHTLNA